jgi:hypothetical protein
MREAGMEETKRPACEEFAPRLMLFVAGELDASEIADVNEHLQHCSGCNLALAQEQEMLALLASRHTEPDAALLASCRAGLEDGLDQQEERSWLGRTIGALLPASWISPQPAWSAALLVLIGFSVGMLGPRLLRNSAGKVDRNSSLASNNATGAVQGVVNADPASASSPSAGLSSLDMRTASVAGINVSPAEDNQPPQVQLQLNARQPYTVRGTVNDDDVKQMLMYILHRHGQSAGGCRGGSSPRDGLGKTNLGARRADDGRSGFGDHLLHRPRPVRQIQRHISLLLSRPLSIAGFHRRGKIGARRAFRNCGNCRQAPEVSMSFRKRSICRPRT